MLAFLAALHFAGVPAATADDKKDKKEGADSFIIELPVTEADAIKAVADVADDGIIHGTRVYDKEPILQGATYETSSTYFGRWQGPGHVYYKIFTDALSPRHFKEAQDTGTISLRFVVQAVSPNDTRIQIDAAFVEDGRHKVHP